MKKESKPTSINLTPPTRIKLSPSSVKGILLPATGKKMYWDLQLPGFGIRAVPTGKSYVVRTRVGGGKQGRDVIHTVGRCNEIALPTARTKAMKALAAIRSGADLNKEQVQQAKLDKVQGVTLRQAYEDFLASRNLRPRTAYVYNDNINRCAGDWLDLPLVSIDKHMVLKRYRKLSNSNGKRSTSMGAASADQFGRLLRVIFNHAIATYDGADGQPLIGTNPVGYLKQINAWNKPKTRDRVLDESVLADWYKATLEIGKERKEVVKGKKGKPKNITKPGNPALRDALLFMLFSGLRRNECLQLQWKHVDRKSEIKTLTIPAELSKTHRPRKLPLSDVLLQLLQQRHDEMVVGNPYVFQSSVNKLRPLVEPRKAINSIKKAISAEFSSHDLRRSFATFASRMDIPYIKLKHLLGHSLSNDVTANNYVQIGIEDLKPEMQKIADWLKLKCNIQGVLIAAENQG